MGSHTVSLTALLGLLGYTIASFLGIWLIISIFRSGRK
jgi:ubiquinone biosynthesis protein